MTNAEQLWQLVWSWIVANVSVERASLVISLLAFAVAVRGVRHAKRSARAAEIQARAAEEQADAAERQVEAAYRQIYEGRAVDSVRISEASALIEYRGFLESNMPKIVVGVELTEYPPVWKKHEWSEITSGDSKYPMHDFGRGFIVYSLNENMYDELSFIVRGVMANVGDVAAHVVAVEPKFVEGESVLTSGIISIPQYLGRGNGHLLKPGEMALFEWSASRTVEQWAEIYKDGHRGSFKGVSDDWKPLVGHPVGRFLVHPAGSALDATMQISIEVGENVIWPDFYPGREVGLGERWFTHDGGTAEVYVKHEYMRLPKGLDDLRKLVKSVNLWGRVED
ncbi:hypothetical protein ACFV0L_28515 [Streptosporangium canum]|uniref:hypothetical protein n=1 Tax=Streptosporangium canum TaxID=324952 RepID=UPI003678D586